MNTTIDNDSLEDILGMLPDDKNNQTAIVHQPIINDSSNVPAIIQKEEKDVKYVDDELKKLMLVSTDLMSTAKAMMEAMPDGDNVSAVANMISSVNGIITEFNKSVIMNKRFEDTQKLEILKHKLRMKEIEAKSKALPGAIKAETFNQQNNFYAVTPDLIANALIKKD